MWCLSVVSQCGVSAWWSLCAAGQKRPEQLIAGDLLELHFDTCAHTPCTFQVIMVSMGGGWKLAGFGFAVATDYALPSSSSPSYDYSDPFPPLGLELSQVGGCVCVCVCVHVCVHPSVHACVRLCMHIACMQERHVDARETCALL